MHRVRSRAVLIDFILPAIAPETDEEEVAFGELEELLASGEVSSAIGWAVSVGKNLEKARGHISSLASQLRGTFSGRLCKNWATLLFFLEKVRFNLSPVYYRLEYIMLQDFSIIHF